MLNHKNETTLLVLAALGQLFNHLPNWRLIAVVIQRQEANSMCNVMWFVML